MRTSSWRAAAAACLTLTLVLSACSSGDSSPPLTDLAPLTSPAIVATTAAPPSTDATTTTMESTTSTLDPTATTVLPPLGLSPDGPWKLVDSAPGVEGVGLVYELMPKLWVFLPTEVDLERGYLWTFNEQDRPVIEAYLLAILTRYRSTDSVPATLDDEGWTLYYTADAADELRVLYAERSDRGEYTDLDLGVVLRPVVIEDDRSATYTVVTDCRLDGAVLRNADGSLALGATPGITESGFVAGMVLQASQWKIDGFNITPAGCA